MDCKEITNEIATSIRPMLNQAVLDSQFQNQRLLLFFSATDNDIFDQDEKYYYLFLSDCDWKLTSPTMFLVASEDSAVKIQQEIAKLHNKRLLSVSVDCPSFATKFEFEDDLILSLSPSRTQGKYEYWSVYLGEERAIRVGP